MFLPFAIIILVLQNRVFAGILPREANSTTTTTSRSTSKTSSSLSSSSSSQGDCCAVLANGVGLELWYTGSVEITVATIVTQIIHYNNTVVTSLHTVTNNVSQSWTTGEYAAGELTISGLPTNLVSNADGGGYEATTIATDTALTFDGTIVFVIISPCKELSPC
jgi:hypothetical protein